MSTASSASNAPRAERRGATSGDPGVAARARRGPAPRPGRSRPRRGGGRRDPARRARAGPPRRLVDLSLGVQLEVRVRRGELGVTGFQRRLHLPLKLRDRSTRRCWEAVARTSFSSSSSVDRSGSRSTGRRKQPAPVAHHRAVHENFPPLAELDQALRPSSSISGSTSSPTNHSSRGTPKRS